MLFSTIVTTDVVGDYRSSDYDPYVNEGTWLCRDEVQNIFFAIYNSNTPETFKIEVFNKKGIGRFPVKFKPYNSVKNWRPMILVDNIEMDTAHCIYNTAKSLGLINKKVWVKFIPIDEE